MPWWVVTNLPEKTDPGGPAPKLTFWAYRDEDEARRNDPLVRSAVVFGIDSESATQWAYRSKGMHPPPRIVR